MGERHMRSGPGDWRDGSATARRDIDDVDDCGRRHDDHDGHTVKRCVDHCSLAKFSATHDDMVDETIFLRLFCGEPAVAFAVCANLVDFAA